MAHLKHIALATLAATAAALISPAIAAPLSVTSEARLRDAAVDLVAYGCGPGWTVNRRGECRPMHRRYGYYGPRYDYYLPRAYARPVLHIGPFGAGVSFR